MEIDLSTIKSFEDAESFTFPHNLNSYSSLPARFQLKKKVKLKNHIPSSKYEKHIGNCNERTSSDETLFNNPLSLNLSNGRCESVKNDKHLHGSISNRRLKLQKLHFCSLNDVSTCDQQKMTGGSILKQKDENLAKTHNDIDKNIGDCLIDLDNFLEEIDKSIEIQNQLEIEEEIKEKERSRTFSLDMWRINQTLPIKLKCTQRTSSLLERSIEYGSQKIFSRSGIRKSFTNVLKKQKTTTKNDFGTEDTFELSLEERSYRNTNNLCEENNYANDLRSELFCNGDNVKNISCTNFKNEIHPTNSTQTITQELIFQNILSQNNDSNSLGDRPRQFGRRGEGFRRTFTLLADGSIDSNNVCVVNQQLRSSCEPSTSTNSVNQNIESQQNGTSFHNALAESSNQTSGNSSPVTFVSRSESCFTPPPNHPNNESNYEGVGNQHHGISNNNEIPQDIYCSTKSEWPHNFSRTLALLSCTLGLFNICRFATLTVNYGGNFLIQFILLSFFFGIPLFWLQMALGAKIRAGPISMWKISPICKGIGISLLLVQFLIAIYSTITVAWVLVYFRNFALEKTYTTYRSKVEISQENGSNLTQSISEIFNLEVLQRLQLSQTLDSVTEKFRVSDKLVFHLIIVWAIVFIALCKGLKTFGKVIYPLTLTPIFIFIAVTSKFLLEVNPSKMKNIFSAGELNDFLINSKTWIAAAQEVFLTWGLLGSSIISITSCIESPNRYNKSVLRRDAIVVVLATIFILCIAALLGLTCIEILNQYSYIYVPGSFEQFESSCSIYSTKAHLNVDTISYPTKWIPHYSTFVGEIYRRPIITIHQYSGYQALRFISELFPAIIILTSGKISWIWISLSFVGFIFFALAQLCIMWKPISSTLGSSTSSVLFSCVTGFLLSIPFTTENGISILYYMDILLGGAWFVPILWAAAIFGVFLVCGRPYNGDDLVNDMKMSSSLSAFLALSWNVLLPVSLIILSVINYKCSLASEFYYWRGKAYFSYWARKTASLIQVGILLLIPIIAILQIFRYLTKGPSDILDRIQLLYRPSEDIRERQRMNTNSFNNNVANQEGRNNILNPEHIAADTPPKYTPPPSYTTATGARIAKILRRSVRRALRVSGRLQSNFSSYGDYNQDTTLPTYLSIDSNVNENNERIQTNSADHTHESLSVPSKPELRQSNTMLRNLPTSTPNILERTTYDQHPYTELVGTSMLSSSSARRTRSRTISSHSLNEEPRNQHYESNVDLISYAEPVDLSQVIATAHDDYTEQSNTSVI